MEGRGPSSQYRTFCRRGLWTINRLQLCSGFARWKRQIDCFFISRTAPKISRKNTKMSGRRKLCNRVSRVVLSRVGFFPLATFYKRTERTGRPTADAYRHVAHMPVFFWPDWRLQGCRGVRTDNCRSQPSSDSFRYLCSTADRLIFHSTLLTSSRRFRHTVNDA